MINKEEMEVKTFKKLSHRLNGPFRNLYR